MSESATATNAMMTDPHAQPTTIVDGDGVPSQTLYLSNLNEKLKIAGATQHACA